MDATPRHDDSLWQDIEPLSSRRLLLAAVDCFSRRGYNAATTREIGRLAGMSAAAVYTHYPSKHAMLFEISRIGHAASLEEVLAAIDGVDDPVERLWRLMSTFVAWHARNHTVARVNQYELPSLPAELFEQIRALRRDFEDVLISALRSGIDSGDFDVVDFDGTRLALLSLGIDVARWYTGRGFSPNELAVTYADISLRIVGARRR